MHFSISKDLKTNFVAKISYTGFGMRSSTLKWIVLTGSLIIAMIIAVQLYWLNHIYNLEKKQFNTTVVKCVRGLFEDVQLAGSPTSHLKQVIHQQPNNSTFITRIDRIPDTDSVLTYLTKELAGFEVLTACNVAIYDNDRKTYTYKHHLPSPTEIDRQLVETIPVFKADYHYLLLQFPERNRYILSQMDFWIVSSIILLLVLIALALSMFYFYKQKFLVEIQKDFVNNFTHEFKTPLAVMKIAADVLAQPEIIKQPQRMDKYTSIMKNETEHLQHQVERLLKMAVSERGSLSVEMERFAVSDMIEQAIAKLQPLIEASNAKIEINLPEEETIFTADKTHLELAIVNLIENAIKYSRTPVIVIQAGNSGADNFIAVKDNGVGIEKKYFKNIFKKFYRVPTGDVHNVKGFGLGLNFVKKIVDAHDGKIIVHSVPGIGTEFKILIPV